MTRSIPTVYLIVLVAVFAALQLLLGILSLPQSSRPAASVLAMIIFATALISVLVPHPTGLPRSSAALTVVATVAVTMLVQLGLSVTTWPGYSAWHPSALQCLLIVVALRGRLVAAASGCALFTGCTLWWSAHTIGGVGYGLRLSLAPVLFVLVAVALARFLARNDQRAAEQTSRALALLDQAAAAEAQRAEALTWVRDVASIAGPSLRLAANAEAVLTAGDRARMQVAEASLRDRIRGGSLASPAMLAAAAAARAHGVTVRLLDDRSDALPRATVEAVTRALVDLLPDLAPGVLTVRARPAWPEATIAYDPDDPSVEPIYAEI